MEWLETESGIQVAKDADRLFYRFSGFPKLEPKMLDGTSKVLGFVISDETPDRDGDILGVSGWSLKEYHATGGPVLDSHDMRTPIGASKVRKQDGKLKAAVQFAGLEHISQKGEMWFRFITELGVGRPSVGFIPFKRRVLTDKDMNGRQSSAPFENLGYYYMKQSLSEWSMVTIPSNPGVSRDESLDRDLVRAVGDIARGFVKGAEYDAFMKQISGEGAIVLSHPGVKLGAPIAEPGDPEEDMGEEWSPFVKVVADEPVEAKVADPVADDMRRILLGPAEVVFDGKTIGWTGPESRQPTFGEESEEIKALRERVESLEGMLAAQGVESFVRSVCEPQVKAAETEGRDTLAEAPAPTFDITAIRKAIREEVDDAFVEMVALLNAAPTSKDARPDPAGRVEDDAPPAEVKQVKKAQAQFQYPNIEDLKRIIAEAVDDAKGAIR